MRFIGVSHVLGVLIILYCDMQYTWNGCSLACSQINSSNINYVHIATSQFLNNITVLSAVPNLSVKIQHTSISSIIKSCIGFNVQKGSGIFKAVYLQTTKEQSMCLYKLQYCKSLQNSKSRSVIKKAVIICYLVFKIVCVKISHRIWTFFINPNILKGVD